MTVTVTRLYNTLGSVTVNYGTAPGTADAAHREPRDRSPMKSATLTAGGAPDSSTRSWSQDAGGLVSSTRVIGSSADSSTRAAPILPRRY